MTILLKLILLLVHVAWGMLLATLIHLDWGKRINGLRWGQLWQQRLLRILGIRVRTTGMASTTPATLVVSNHVSWLDIPVLGASGQVRFVSKSEIRHWPIAGWLAGAIDTIFIRRGAGGARPVVEKISQGLQQNSRIVVFPEGTTTDGSTVLKFYPRLFQAALDTNTVVQPITLIYGVDASGVHIAPFIGDDTLVAHVWRVLNSRGLVVHVCFGPCVQPEQFNSRDALALAAEHVVRRQLQPAAASIPAMDFMKKAA